MTLSDWLDPLFDGDEMRAADAWASGPGEVASLELMEQAGEGLARATADVAGEGMVRIVVGKGNNGGDGLVAARLLREQARDVEVLAVAPLDELQGDARANLERLPGEEPVPFDDSALEGSGVIVDAMLGTGFSGSPREPAASAIATINANGSPVVACDVPSGVNAGTGEVEGDAVRASVTATFHAPKIGLQVAPGAFHAGEVRVVDIGIPTGAPSARTAGLIAERVLGLVPRRTPEGSKFASGAVLIAGGARGLTGAPCMAALAAMRAGAGYVQAAVPSSLEPVFEVRLLEALTRGLPEEDGAHRADGAEAVADLAERADAVVLGPGIGRSEGALEFARAVAWSVEKPLLVDADGLNAHAGVLEVLAGRRGPTVLTPHAGELARLLGTDSASVNARRLAHVREAAQRSRAVVVLKGHDTLVAAPDRPVAVGPGATPALATAGTGDVLSGVIGALLAKGLGAYEAAAAGVLAHARAGAAAAARHGPDHVIASDVIEALPAGFSGRPAA